MRKKTTTKKIGILESLKGVAPQEIREHIDNEIALPIEEIPLPNYQDIVQPNEAVPNEASMNVWRKMTTNTTRTPYPKKRTFVPQAMEEIIPAQTPSDAEDFDILRESLQVMRVNEGTNIFAVVFDKKNEENVLFHLQCYGGTAFGGYAHDLSKDSYLVECVDCLQVGQIPYSFALTMKNVGQWHMRVPIPEPILEKCFNPQQRKLIEDQRTKYPAPRYEIHFIQMLGCM